MSATLYCESAPVVLESRQDLCNFGSGLGLNSAFVGCLLLLCIPDYEFGVVCVVMESGSKIESELVTLDVVSLIFIEIIRVKN
jgi:hypothetical protein